METCARSQLNAGRSNSDAMKSMTLPASGGPLALVRDGDEIELDVAARKLHLHVDDAELARRRTEWQAPAPRMTSGYQRLYHDHVQQADAGCDLDFLVGRRGAEVPRESH